jgi:hypothetical protein
VYILLLLERYYVTDLEFFIFCNISHKGRLMCEEILRVFGIFASLTAFWLICFPSIITHIVQLLQA